MIGSVKQFIFHPVPVLLSHGDNVRLGFPRNSRTSGFFGCTVVVPFVLFHLPVPFENGLRPDYGADFGEPFFNGDAVAYKFGSVRFSEFDPFS